MSIRLNAAATPMSIRLKANGGTASLRLTQGRTGPAGPPGPPGGAADADVAAVVNDPQSQTRAALATTFAPVEDREPILFQQARASKGGAIGIGSKAAVALRFDDGHTVFNSTMYPLLTARGLPAGFASISDLSAQPWSSATPSSTVKTWNQNGIEIWSHGLDHLDPSPNGREGIRAQVEDSKTTIESWGVKCQGWMQPGATPVGPDVPYESDFTTIDSLYKTYAGRLVRNTYPLSEHYAGGKYRNIPHGAYHGVDHITVSDGEVTLAAAKTHVDKCIARRMGVEFMCHTANLDQPGRMTLADFTALLDYIVEKRDAGLIEVLTPSGLMFADTSSNRIDLLNNGSFESSATSVNETYGWTGPWTGQTIETSGGYNGSRFYRSTGSSLLNQRPDSLDTLGFGGETFIMEAMVRAIPGGPTGQTVSRFVVADYNDSSRLNLSLVRVVPSTSWTKIRHAFSLHPDTTRLSIGIGRNSGDSIDWDDVHLWKV